MSTFIIRPTERFAADESYILVNADDARSAIAFAVDYYTNDWPDEQCQGAIIQESDDDANDYWVAEEVPADFTAGVITYNSIVATQWVVTWPNDIPSNHHA